MGVLVIWNPGPILSETERTASLWGLGFLTLMGLASLAKKLRQRSDPEYATRTAAWQAYSVQFEAMVDDLVVLFDQGCSDEEIAVRVVSKTGYDYEQALADVQQLRLDYEAGRNKG
jgi:hypothetical protein